MTTSKANSTENEIQEQLGHVREFLSDTNDLVTLVRRTVSYDEMLITRKQFNEINRRLTTSKNDEKLYPFDIGREYKNQLIAEGDKNGNLRPGDHISDGWYHFSEMDVYSHEIDPPKYVAFPGDVTTYTDDAIGYMFATSWSNGGRGIKEAKEAV